MSDDKNIGRYEVEKLLGRGAMGDVFRAHDPQLDRAVAIKTIRLDSPLFHGDSTELMDGFQAEARAAAGLSHPNIVTVFDFGDENGLYYLVMEYVEGQTLAKRLAGGALPPGEAAAVIQQACEALAAAHDAGVVHRDIKPGNLMVDSKTGLVKVMDFGIAKMEMSARTQTGTIVGTPRYMSPEQIRGEPVDRRSDIYSLGAVYCEALTGKLLSSGGDLTAIAHEIINEEPECVSEVERRLGEGPAWVLRRAMAKEPEKRFQTAGEFRDAIEMYCVGSATVPPGSIVVEAPSPAEVPDAPAAPAPPPAAAPAPRPAPTPVPQPVASGIAAPSLEGAGAGMGADEGLPDRPGQADPVFTAPRRAKGPGKGLALTSVVTVVTMGVAVGAWLKFGGGFPPQGVVVEDGLDAAAEPALVAASDSSETTTESMQVGELPPPAEAQPAVLPPVRLEVTVEPGVASLWVDDTLVVSAEVGAMLLPGQHTVHAESEGYLPLDTTIDLSADTSVALVLTRAPPSTGTVDVRASIPGRVTVDGRDRGAAPLRGLEMRPGTYAVRFVPEAGDALAQLRTAKVVAGQAVTVSFEVTDALLSVGVRQPRWATVYAGEVRLGDTPLIEHRMPARVYQVRVEREGYVTQERLVQLEPGESFEWVDVVLEEDGTQ